MKVSRVIAVALALVPLALIAIPIMVAGGGATTGSHPSCELDPVNTDSVVTVEGLDAEQARNAGIIVTVGRAADVPADGLAIALATAYQESKLRNIGFGDRDSLGLFQQRPSSGWGSPEQLLDPVYAAQAFYGGPNGPHSGEPPGLLDIDGWQTMSPTDAAQAVQRSAFPDAYAQWEDDAKQWLAALMGVASGSCSPSGGLACPPTGLAAESNLTPDALRTLRCIATQFSQITTFAGVGERPNASHHPSGRAVDAMIPGWQTDAGIKFGWEVAEWIRANHTCLGATEVIWDANIWTTARADLGWRPYEHPSGATDPTSRHKDHVHVSVAGSAGSCADGTWVVPLAGTYTVTEGFGAAGEHWSTTHTGIDLAAPTGRDVVAAAGGTITYAGTDGPYGKRIEITHPDGTRTWYAHLSAISTATGAVTAGQTIGLVGATGNVTGPHLHFEVRPATMGEPVDPAVWMASRGVRL